MKIKVDLHPIFNDTRKIEDALQSAMDEAVKIRATLVEIIPGKGSGALKKSVLRFLERPDIKALYHRIEKDGDNWGRLFVHFRPGRPEEAAPQNRTIPTSPYRCFCCDAANEVAASDDWITGHRFIAECPSCGSPNKLEVRALRSGEFRINASPGYDGT